jgi:hypothetical protein
MKKKDKKLLVSRESLEQFCATTKREEGGKGAYVSKDDISNEYVRVLLTKSILLQRLCEAKNVHLDATYKLVDIGYPLIVLGVTMFNSHFT